MALGFSLFIRISSLVSKIYFRFIPKTRKSFLRLRRCGHRRNVRPSPLLPLDKDKCRENPAWFGVVTGRRGKLREFSLVLINDLTDFPGEWHEARSEGEGNPVPRWIRLKQAFFFILQLLFYSICLRSDFFLHLFSNPYPFYCYCFTLMDFSFCAPFTFFALQLLRNHLRWVLKM